MKLYTALIKEKEELLVQPKNSSYVYLLRELGMDFEDMNGLICHMSAEQRAYLDNIREKEISARPIHVDGVRLLAPIVRPRQDVICLGINYDEHAAEAGKFSEEAFGGERPYTIYFSKRVNRATATGEKIPSYSDLVDSLDYEAELGVILGKDTKRVKAEEALSSVFGYTVVNDISARNLQTRHKQWYMGKSLDGFTPMGPCIVTADEIEDVQSLAIRCLVNGKVRQSSNTRYMLQTVAGAIAELSAGITLQAGTIIATGTPAGVGMGMQPPTFLRPGDKVVCEIEKIGRLENEIGD